MSALFFEVRGAHASPDRHADARTPPRQSPHPRTPRFVWAKEGPPQNASGGLHGRTKCAGGLPAFVPVVVLPRFAPIGVTRSLSPWAGLFFDTKPNCLFLRFYCRWRASWASSWPWPACSRAKAGQAERSPPIVCTIHPSLCALSTTHRVRCPPLIVCTIRPSLCALCTPHCVHYPPHSSVGWAF